MLRRIGNERVGGLDGVVPRWRRAKLSFDTRMRSYPREHPLWFPRCPASHRDDVLAHFGNERMLILDARSPERFSGEQEKLDPVSGRILVAVNAWSSTISRTSAARPRRQRTCWQGSSRSRRGASRTTPSGSGARAWRRAAISWPWRLRACQDRRFASDPGASGARTLGTHLLSINDPGQSEQSRGVESSALRMTS